MYRQTNNLDLVGYFDADFAGYVDSCKSTSGYIFIMTGGVGRLMYAQVCTILDIVFAIRVLGRYQSNLGMNHSRATKKAIRYLQGTKDYMLMYR